jgi:hypothetical protein
LNSFDEFRSMDVCKNDHASDQYVY